MIERVYYRVKLDANTFIYTPYLSNIPKSITDIPTNVTYDTTDGITLKADETWTYDNGESAKVTTEREIPMKAGDGVTMDVSEDGKYIVIKVDPKRETHIGTSVPTDDYPDLFVNTADDSLSYKAPDGSWKPIAGGSGGGLVDDVQINGQSIVENKVANIVVDTALNARSSNPVANSLLAVQVTALGTALMGHTNNNDNPHSVTKVQVGLGNVDNTSDANKPVSTAQQTALDKKIDKAGGTFSGNVAIQGNLTVSGTTTTESEKQLAVKENVIVTNADKVNLQALLSGLAINKNSTATYGIMYDPADDTVKFGEGTLDANRKFVFKTGEGHPLAIRADSSQFTAGHLVKWDATKKQFVDAGKGIDGGGKTPKSIDAVTGNFTNITYDTVDGLTLGSVAKIINTDDSETDFTLSQEIPLLGSANISIDLDEANQKLVFSLDKNNSIILTGIGKILGVGDENFYLGFTLNPLPTVVQRANVRGTPITSIYNLPAVGNTTANLLSDKNVKTLFGNKSIVGIGNIDLYQHVIKFASNDNEVIMFTVISSKNVIVDSLTDLKTLLGNTFEYPVSGTRTAEPIMAINQTGYATVSSYYKGDWYTYPSGTWTDTVTTV